MAESKNYMQRIKAVQDILRKDSLQKYYQSAILGFTILKRLCQEFEPKRLIVKKKYDEMIKNGDENIDKSALMAESGLGYYNISGISFHDLTTDTQKIYANIKKLIESFSDNITAIFDKKGLDLVNTCSVINEKKALEEIVNKFDKMDLSKEAMNNADMGAFFGELVVMVYGTVENGENWTPSDFVSLLTKLLLAEGCEYLNKGFNTIKLIDNAVGSGQLTSHFSKIVTDPKLYKGENEVIVCGQDNSDLNIAVCKAEQIMLGQKPDNFRVGDTLTQDKFENMEFDFLIQNAPYGCGRKKADEGTIKELLGEDLPGSTDNQMLFWKAGLRKLKTGGRAALLSNGSPLFSGSTLSGESKIRKWLFDNDYVEAIIKLTDQGFLDTGISIYAWILNKGNKPANRKGIIQIIDASSFYHPLKKGIGQKRKEMTKEDIDKIVSLYTSFPETNEYVKNMTKEDFYYKEVTVCQPYQRNFQISEDRIQNLYSQTAFNSLWDEEEYDKLIDENATEDVVTRLKELTDGKQMQKDIFDILMANVSDVVYKNKCDFEKKIKSILPESRYLISENKIEKVKCVPAFIKLFIQEEYNELLKNKDDKRIAKKIEKLNANKALQEDIINKLRGLVSDKIYKSKEDFEALLSSTLPTISKGLFNAIIKVFADKCFPSNIINATVNALSEKDKTSDTYKDEKQKSGLLADGDLNDSEYVSVKEKIDDYYQREVKPFVPDSWWLDDFGANADPYKQEEKEWKTVGCEINFNKYFYKYIEPRKADVILDEIKGIVDQEKDFMEVLLND